MSPLDGVKYTDTLGAATGWLTVTLVESDTVPPGPVAEILWLNVPACVYSFTCVPDVPTATPSTVTDVALLVVQ